MNRRRLSICALKVTRRGGSRLLAPAIEFHHNVRINGPPVSHGFRTHDHARASPRARARLRCADRPGNRRDRRTPGDPRRGLSRARPSPGEQAGQLRARRSDAGTRRAGQEVLPRDTRGSARRPEYTTRVRRPLARHPRVEGGSCMKKPPTVATTILMRLGPEDECIIGDLLEEYEAGRSRWWFWHQAVSAIVSGAILQTRARPARVLVAVAIGWASLLSG